MSGEARFRVGVEQQARRANAMIGFGDAARHQAKRPIGAFNRASDCCDTPLSWSRVARNDSPTIGVKFRFGVSDGYFNTLSSCCGITYIKIRRRREFLLATNARSVSPLPDDPLFQEDRVYCTTLFPLDARAIKQNRRIAAPVCCCSGESNYDSFLNIGLR